MVINNLHPAEYVQTPLDIKLLEPYCLAQFILFIASRVYARYIWYSPWSQATPLTPFDKSDLTLAEAAYFYSYYLPEEGFTRLPAIYNSHCTFPVFQCPYLQSLLNPSRNFTPILGAQLYYRLFGF